MRNAHKGGLVAGAVFAWLAMTASVEAGVTKLVLYDVSSYKIDTCAEAFHKVDGKGGFVNDTSLPTRTEIKFTSFDKGDEIPNDPTKHRIKITDTSHYGKRFDWEELLPNPPPAMELRSGFDVVIVATYKKVSAFIAVPPTSEGTNYGDLSSSHSSIKFVLFCAKKVVIPPPPPEGCLLSTSVYHSVCDRLQSDPNLNPDLDESPTISFALTVAGRTFESLCTCPGPDTTPAEAQFECNPNPICETEDATLIPQCTGDGGVAAEDECDIASGLCCAGAVSLAPAETIDATPQIGSCRTTIKIGGTRYTITDNRGPPCPKGWTAF